MADTQSSVATATTSSPPQSVSMIVAATTGSLERVRDLVRRGASVNTPDAQGTTPLQHAINAGHDEVASFLREHGAVDSSALVRRFMAQYSLGPAAPPPPPPRSLPPQDGLSGPAAVGLHSPQFPTTPTPGSADGAFPIRAVRRNASFVSPPPEIYLNRTVISTPSGELSLEDLFHEVDTNGDRRISAMHELPVALTIMGLHWDEQLGVALLADRTGVDALEVALSERCQEWWGADAVTQSSELTHALAAGASQAAASTAAASHPTLQPSITLQDAIDVDSDADSTSSAEVDRMRHPDAARSTSNFARAEVPLGNGAGSSGARGPPPPPPKSSCAEGTSAAPPPPPPGATRAVSNASATNSHTHRRSSSAGPLEDRLIDWTTFCSIVALLQAAGAYKEVIRKLLRERAERARAAEAEAAMAVRHLEHRRSPVSRNATTIASAAGGSAGLSPRMKSLSVESSSPARMRSRSDLDHQPAAAGTMTSNSRPKGTVVPPLLPNKRPTRGHAETAPEISVESDTHDDDEPIVTARSVDVGVISRRGTAERRRKPHAHTSSRRSPAGASLRRSQTESQHRGSIVDEAAASAEAAPKDKRTQAIERMTSLLKSRGSVMSGISSLALGARLPISSLNSSGVPRRTPTGHSSSFFATLADLPPHARQLSSDASHHRTDHAIGHSSARMKRNSSNDISMRTAPQAGRDSTRNAGGHTRAAEGAPALNEVHGKPPAAQQRRRRVTAIETGLAHSFSGPASAPARHTDSFVMPNLSPHSPGGAQKTVSRGSHPVSPSTTFGAMFRRQSLRRLATSPANGAPATVAIDADHAHVGMRSALSASAAELALRAQSSRFSFDSSRTSPSGSGPHTARSAADDTRAPTDASAGVAAYDSCADRSSPPVAEAEARQEAGGSPAHGSVASLQTVEGATPRLPGPTQDGGAAGRSDPAGAAATAIVAAPTAVAPPLPPPIAGGIAGLAPHGSAGQMSSITELPDGSTISESGDEALLLAPSHEVFLGGACNPTTWRKTTAMPALEAAGITYYNPQVDDWKPELVVQEAKAKDEADAVFFVVGPETRAVASMIEVAELISSGRPVVLVLQDVPKDAIMNGHALHADEVKDLNRGRAYLANVADRHGVTVYQSIEAALREVVSLIHAKRAERQTAYLSLLERRGGPRHLHASGQYGGSGSDENDSAASGVETGNMTCGEQENDVDGLSERLDQLHSVSSNARSSIFTTVSAATAEAEHAPAAPATGSVASAGGGSPGATAIHGNAGSGSSGANR